MLESMANAAARVAFDPSACESFLVDASVAAPQYGGLSFSDTEGTVLCTSVPTDVRSVSDRDWFGLVSRSGAFTVGPPVIGLVSREWVSVLATPVYDNSGKRLGYLTAATNLNRLRELLTIASLPEEAVTTLTNTVGIIVARSRDPEHWVGEQVEIAPPEYEDLELRERIAPSAEGVPYMWAWEELTGAGWFVYSGLPADWALNRVLPGLGLGISVGSLLVLAILMFASGVYRRVRVSLAQLVEGTRSAAHGPIALDKSELAEVAEVARQFNETLGERNKAEAALLSAKKLYQSVLENAALGILVVVEDGSIVEANASLAAMIVAETPSALLGENVSSVFDDTEDWERVRKGIDEEGGRFVVDTLWVRKDGDRFSVRLSTSQIELSDEGVGFVLLAEDVTERQQLEAQFRQSQKLESVGRLAGGIAHDFNNRLTVIQNCAELLRDKVESDSESREAVSSILESTARSGDLTRQLLTFSRRQVASRRTVDLNSLLTDFQKMFSRVLEEDIEIAMDLAGQTCPVSIDPGQMEQVILNLASNAGDAMPNGGDLVFSTRLVELTERDAAQHLNAKSGAHVVLSVRDSGCGIDENTLPKVFEPFFTTKPVGKGTGLGLSTAYGIVQHHDGHIRLWSEPDAGTTFEIWLPVADPAGIVVESEELQKIESGRTRQGTVLVAEDDPAVLRVVKAILKRAGYDVLTASSGLEALRLASEYDGTIDALVTDWIMPGIRGPELARKLSQERPSLSVLYMSGYTDEQLGADEAEFVPGVFLGKPFTIGELLSRLAEAMQAR